MILQVSIHCVGKNNVSIKIPTLKLKLYIAHNNKNAIHLLANNDDWCEEKGKGNQKRPQLQNNKSNFKGSEASNCSQPKMLPKITKISRHFHTQTNTFSTNVFVVIREFDFSDIQQNTIHSIGCNSLIIY